MADGQKETSATNAAATPALPPGFKLDPIPALPPGFKLDPTVGDGASSGYKGRPLDFLKSHNVTRTKEEEEALWQDRRKPGRGTGLDELSAIPFMRGAASVGAGAKLLPTIGRELYGASMGAVGGAAGAAVAHKTGQLLGLPHGATVGLEVAASILGARLGMKLQPGDVGKFLEEEPNPTAGKFLRWMHSKGKPVPETVKTAPVPSIRPSVRFKETGPIAEPPPIKFNKLPKAPVATKYKPPAVKWNDRFKEPEPETIEKGAEEAVPPSTKAKTAPGELHERARVLQSRGEAKRNYLAARFEDAGLTPEAVERMSDEDLESHILDEGKSLQSRGAIKSPFRKYDPGNAANTPYNIMKLEIAKAMRVRAATKAAGSAQ